MTLTDLVHLVREMRKQQRRWAASRDNLEALMRAERVVDGALESFGTFPWLFPDVVTEALRRAGQGTQEGRLSPPTAEDPDADPPGEGGDL